MKKVLIGLTYYKPNISGVTVYAEILAKEMKNVGFEVTVLTSKHQRDLRGVENDNGVKVMRSFVLFSLGKGLFMPLFWLDAIRAVKDCDVVNCHLPQLESCMLAILARIFRKKLVVTHHCEFGFTGTLNNKLIATISYPFHLITYFLADKIVSYTQDYAEHSMFLKRFSKKIRYILPPIVVCSSGTKIVKKEGKTKIVGYVGRIGWEKGLNYLVGAFLKLEKKHQNWKLELVGPYREVAGDRSFEKLKPMLNKSKNIILHGPMEHEMLSGFYRECDCLVLPSTDNLETFGLVQAEAMICGCPVVASNLPGVRMPIKMTGMGEIVNVGDVDDLVNKIEVVILNPKYKVNQELAQKLFSIKKFINSYQLLFESV